MRLSLSKREQESGGRRRLVQPPQLGVILDDLGSPRVLPPPLFTGGDKENNNIIKGCSMESHLAAKRPRADPPGQHINGPAK